MSEKEFNIGDYDDDALQETIDVFSEELRQRAADRETHFCPACGQRLTRRQYEELDECPRQGCDNKAMRELIKDE